VAIYPNPAIRELNVQIQTNQYSKVKIDIFNMLGQLVGHIHDGGIGDGEYVFNWSGIGINGRPLPSGVYIIRVDFGMILTPFCRQGEKPVYS
jgi:flagellar hook assembly protein FlgD